MDVGSVCRMVCLFTSKLTAAPSYAAWSKRHIEFPIFVMDSTVQKRNLQNLGHFGRKFNTQTRRLLLPGWCVSQMTGNHFIACAKAWVCVLLCSRRTVTTEQRTYSTITTFNDLKISVRTLHACNSQRYAILSLSVHFLHHKWLF